MNTKAMEKKERIEFIDLAKGLCILLIIIGHCGVTIPIPGFATMQMPLFFVLSGLFVKNSGSFVLLATRRINTILVPFLFFYFVAYIPFYFFESIKPGLIQTSARGLLDVFNNRQFFNGPIWFLLALFWDNLIFCAISLNVKNEWARGFTVLIIGFIGIILGLSGIFIPCFVDVAMTALPFFYFGYLLNKTTLLYPNKFDKYNFLIFIVGYAVLYVIMVLFNGPHISFHYNIIKGNPIWVYIGSFSCVVAVIVLCKMINSLPIISYCGRYSLILLCSHHLIYRPLQLIVNRINIDVWDKLLTAILTIIICIALVPLCIRFIPWFTAQKDLIKPNSVPKNKTSECQN